MILFFYFTEENYCQHYVSSKGFTANCCALWTKLGNDSPFPESQWFLSDLRLHFLKINLRGDWLDLCTNLELPQTHETICNIRNWKSVSENAFTEKMEKKREWCEKWCKSQIFIDNVLSVVLLLLQGKVLIQVKLKNFSNQIFRLWVWDVGDKTESELRINNYWKFLFRMCGNVVIVRVPILVRLTIITAWKFWEGGGIISIGRIVTWECEEEHGETGRRGE